MNRVTMSGDNGFWARVRAALSRAPGGSEPAYGKAEIAKRPGKKLRPAQRIDASLRRAWESAAERKVSLCVLALEMDVYASYFSSYGRNGVEDCLEQLEHLIRSHVPNEQACLRNGRAGFVLVLPDMPNLMARDIAAKIAAGVRTLAIANKESHAGQVTLSMGLAVVNPQGAFDREVLDAANMAVRRAQRRGLARLEVVDFRPSQERKTAA
ncbi:diguanylate cyclase [Devosia sp. WQ 349]|uniref:diguanylate cyclase domain-containing protein n=1 Tax=Devosia sp. WQ 349K1 TaxID=2800329 RepID=UPI00190663C2|nr:diguanylate cyclase [Devosia sp. WQ 349K1]MBK1794298.1 diguanylate cyclase [Devosia sp. WQ 349K1]